MERLLTFVVLYLAVSTVAVLALVVGVFPYHPKTITGWALLFVLALPLTLAGASRRVLLAQPHHAGNRGSLLWQLTVPSAPRLCFRGDAPIFRACLRGTELA